MLCLLQECFTRSVAITSIVSTWIASSLKTIAVSRRPAKCLDSRLLWPRVRCY